jgi:hypothetical protein
MWRKAPLRAGLFPELCWVRTTSCASGQVGPAQSPLDCLRELLDQVPPRRRAGAPLLLCVSDMYARILPLPWTEGLRTDAEQREFGRIAFERAGLPLGADDAIHVEFLHPGAAGMAYAFEQDFLRTVQEACAAGGVRLLNVMPVSALAYVHGARADRVQLLFDRDGLVLLVHTPRGTRRIEAEPAFAGDHPGALARLAARCPELALAPVDWWSAMAAPVALGELLAARLPDRKPKLQPLEHWSMRQ